MGRVALVTDPQHLSVTLTAIFLNVLASPTLAKSKGKHQSQLTPIKKAPLLQNYFYQAFSINNPKKGAFHLEYLCIHVHGHLEL